jgi:hypothetical protein
MMRILTIAALAPCLALPATAQVWDGTPLVNSVPFGGHPADDGRVQKWHYLCHANKPLANLYCRAGNAAHNSSQPAQ